MTLSQVVAGSCDSRLNISSITANMEEATLLDDVNNETSYAKLKNSKAFCVNSKDNFYMQVDFYKLQQVTNLKLQGFVSNGRHLVLPGYSLEFSYDGNTWFKYNEDHNEFPKFFYQVTRDGNTISNNFLNGVGRYMRIQPKWPHSNGNKTKEFCIRFALYGCENIPLPQIKVPNIVASSVNKPIVLSCHASGVVGLQVAWKGFNKTIKKKKTGTYLNGHELTTSLFLNVQFEDLPKFDCQQFKNHLTCKQTFTCKAYYSFDRKIKIQQSTEVVITVVYPDQIGPFNVERKTRKSVELSWNKTSPGDIQVDMLEYQLHCNLSGVLIKENLPFNIVNSRKFSNLGVYTPCSCTLLLVIKNGTTSFPYDINQFAIELSFRSKSLKPSSLPSISAKATAPDIIKVTFKTRFNLAEEGRLMGHKVEAVMMSYGKRNIQHNSFAQIHFVETVSDPNIHEVLLRNIKPWADYNVTVTAYNEDDLFTNYSFQKVATPIGAPSTGPTLVPVFVEQDTSVVLDIKEDSFPMYNHNGIITGYRILIQPGGRVEHFDRTKHFEVVNLLPNSLYTFKCSARTAYQYGPYGELLQVTTKEGRPNEPTNVRVQPSQFDRQYLLISWNAPNRPNGRITKYEIQLLSTKNDQAPHSIQKSSNQTENVKVRSYFEEVASVIIRGYTKSGYGDWSKQVQVNPVGETKDENSGKNDMLIAIVTIGVVVVIAILGIATYFFYTRCRRHRSSRSGSSKHFVQDIACEEMPLRSPMVRSPEGSSSTYYDDDDYHQPNDEKKRRDSIESSDALLGDDLYEAIHKDEFLNYVNTIKQNDYDALSKDFKKLLYGKRYPWHAADKPDNKPKNRYDNIAAYDHSRVILKYDCKQKKSDYINASICQGYNYLNDNTTRYISTQGPIPNTFNDYWHMIWQERINIILMVTNLKENDRVKCHQYWPSCGQTRYGGVAVTLDKIDKTADYVTRTFIIEKVSTKEQRTIRQFHFVSWPDHGVPDYPTALLSLRRRVRFYHDASSPLLVHCSAGVGRSGCFILIDAMLEQIDNTGTVDVFNYLKYLRSRRINMVQTFEQYIFAHTAILEYITFGNTEIIVSELDKKTREMRKGTGMVEEFALLSRNTVRDMSFNPYKVMLLQGKYVDAYHVDGYKQRNAFILNKAPTERNVADFWRMVLEQQCHTIVMLNRTQESSQEYFKYWPEVESHCVYGDMTVYMNSEVAHANIITRKIKVTTNKSRCETHLFQYMDWPEGDVPNRHSYSNICTLMQSVEKSQQTLGNKPIIVHAGNDYGRSGTFTAIYSSTERLKVEQLIDVLQCVRGIRIAQPLAVDNVTQYQFVYNMLRTYLEAFENYCNYSDYKVCRSPLNSTST